MYLRISELSASERLSPQMNNFYRVNDNHWWFVTVGKGNKERQIAVSGANITALKSINNSLPKRDQIEVRQIKYLNNIIEQDHHFIK